MDLARSGAVSAMVADRTDGRTRAIANNAHYSALGRASLNQSSMELVAHPLRFLGRVVVLSLRLTGYSFALAIEVVWHLFNRNKASVGDSVGHFVRKSTDALADVLATR